jgi:carboxyl-terminal processing protease
MKSGFVLVLAGLIAGSSLAFASPAQDLFEQASFYLETQYFGPNPVNMKEHTAKYQPMLDKACADNKDNCAYDKAEPVIAQMEFDLDDPHAYYLTAAAVAEENSSVTGAGTSPVPRIGITHRGFCDTPTGICERDDQGNLKSKQIFDRLVTNVVPGSPAEKAGLMIGDRWVGFNNVLFASAPDAQTANDNLAAFTKLIRAQQPVTMKIVRGVDRQKLDIVVTGAIINTADFPTMTVRSDGIAILSIRTWFLEGQATKVHALVKEAIDKNVKAIVIEQRDNGGGLGAESFASVGAFVETPAAIRRVPRYSAEKGTTEERYSNGTYSIFNLQGVELLNRKFISNPVLFKGPIAMLVNEGCASACEYFASGLQKTKRGPIIGEETAGVGNTNTARFGVINGGAVAFPTVRAFWADGAPLPSSVKPDIVTPNAEFNLFNTGIDQLLQKALESFGAKASAAVSSYTLSPLPDFSGSSTIDSVFQRVSGNLEVVQNNNANLQ